MDFPPAIAMLANVSRWLFGDSLAAVRVFPALEGTVVLVLSALIARELGGGRFAQGLSALATICGVLFQRTSTLFQPVVLDQLWWTLALLVLARLVRERARGAGTPSASPSGEMPLWIALGAALGLGLLTKFSVLFIGFGVLIALLVTPFRRSLLTPRPWVAAGVAFAVGSPSIVGQLRLGYPVVEQMHQLAGSQLQHVSWTDFLVQQPLLTGPVTFLVAVAGLIALLAWGPLRPFSVLAWACVTPFVVLLLLHGKSYYAGPIYPTLIAAGAVFLERLRFSRAPVMAPIARWGTVAGVALFGAIALPIGVPMLSVQGTASYAARLGVADAVRDNMGELDRLPQDYADMLGWEEQARAAARAMQTLSADERRQAVLTGGNYGEAGALEFYSARYALPPVVSGAGSFWYFGPGERPGTVLVAVGTSRRELEEVYADVKEVGRIESPWSVREERHLAVYVARRPNTTLQKLWPSLAERR
jgi:hypothetical protein